MPDSKERIFLNQLLAQWLEPVTDGGSGAHSPTFQLTAGWGLARKRFLCVLQLL